MWRRREGLTDLILRPLLLCLLVLLSGYLPVTSGGSPGTFLTSLSTSPGGRDSAIMGAFYRPPTVSGTVGKRLLALYGGNATTTAMNDLWYYDVGRFKMVKLSFPAFFFCEHLLLLLANGHLVLIFLSSSFFLLRYSSLSPSVS